jgi:hypothetical protein
VKGIYRTVPEKSTENHERTQPPGLLTVHTAAAPQPVTHPVDHIDRMNTSCKFNEHYLQLLLAVFIDIHLRLILFNIYIPHCIA